MSVVYNLPRKQLADSLVVYPDMILLSMYTVINFIGCQSFRKLNSRSGCLDTRLSMALHLPTWRISLFQYQASLLWVETDLQPMGTLSFHLRPGTLPIVDEALQWSNLRYGTHFLSKFLAPVPCLCFVSDSKPFYLERLIPSLALNRQCNSHQLLTII